MTDDYVPTVRIRRPARVATDERGQSVWSDTIETAELELVSTTQLQMILQSGDEASQSAIRDVASGKHEGVLARDPATGLFEVISDQDLQAILGDNEVQSPPRRPTEATLEPAGDAAQGGELSLVSTQMLRTIVKPGHTPRAPRPGTKPAAKKDRSGGFDPYNSG